MSISPSEIRRNAARINGMTGDIRQISRELQAQYRQAGEYWSGTASKSLQSEYQTLDGVMRALLRSLEQLESGVERVASQVQRAEQERAEKKRLEEKLAAEKREREQKEREQGRERARNGR
ncbi:WXG100 family type VII secretion target [Paenibacillus sp. 7124]|uniref:WXG100 family type VII secretion target n=1 Tax=Paenibacillus apii TaxID=1850370 RepID=A0A6M1PH51_9BACL|nr:WXG100 family type VII secretion target [Paenibacillus apii]NGM82827.1 WXG100 family type VII secretion target [Paenibacillus apii]NJJ39967.1 WXG100 family type VII secretion target [Paenibacillus apii]